MVRRHLPWGSFLTGSGCMQRNAEVKRLTAVEPQHLSQLQLLELYLLELTEAVRGEIRKQGN